MSAETYKREKLTKPCVVMVEGADDARLVDALLQHLKCDPVIQIVAAEGKTQISARLRAIRAIEGFREVRALGIIRDADDNPQGAFQSVQGALRGASLPCPSKIGTLTQETPYVGVLIIPSDKEPGSLEDVCLKSLQGDKRMECIEQFINCVEKQQYLIRQPSKAQMAAFLAVHEERPGISLGVAASKGVFNFEHPAFDSLKEFLQVLASKVQSASV